MGVPTTQRLCSWSTLRQCVGCFSQTFKKCAHLILCISNDPLLPYPNSRLSTQAYAAFLKDENAKTTFVNDLKQSFEARNREVLEDEARLKEDNEKLKAELAALEARAPPLAMLKEKKATFVSDKTKFEELIRNLQAHLAKQNAKLQQIQAERQGREAELAHLQQEKGRLKHIQDNQQMTPADVEKINALQHQLERDSGMVAQRKESADQEAWRLEVAVNKRLEQVEQAAAAFNAVVEQAGVGWRTN